MGIFDHWHPVLSAQKLRRRPTAVRLHGTNLVLFRTSSGPIGALEDCCPHRRMKLSLGRVLGDRLECPYHGWTFGCRGDGRSPSTPRLRASAHCFDAREHLGIVWVKSAVSQPEFPIFPERETSGYFHVANLFHDVKAPFELALDNFCEVEHTPTTHTSFGYELGRMSEVRVRFETTDQIVRVVNEGPPKRSAWLYRLLLGIRPGFLFYDDWTTYFSPVYAIFNHWWADPATGTESLFRWKVYVFFTPRDEQTTSLISFVFAKSRYPKPLGELFPVRWLLRRKADYEIRQDVRILEGLADPSVDMKGMKLSRFDKALALNRERIDCVYRGLHSEPAAVTNRQPSHNGRGHGRVPRNGVHRCAGT